MGFRGALTAAVAMALLSFAPSAAARPTVVEIEATGFEPAVAIVPPGSKVKWTNRDSGSRTLEGDVQSPSIPAGGSFERRFPRPGIYEYRDKGNPALTGTVIVAVAGRGRPRPPGPGGPRLVEHHWRGTLRIELREGWKYMDGKFLSFQGVCNAQVGRGSRAVVLRASFPDVKYARAGRIEVLSGKSRPYGMQRYRETIDSRTSNPTGGRIVDCGDGSTDAPPDVDQRCSHDYAGTRVRAELLWSPRVENGRFQWPHDYLGRPPREGNCGHGLLAGTLVGLDPDLLPWDPGAGAKLLYDHGRTDATTRAETRALREGRAVTVERHFELGFTVDCCVGWSEPDKPGTYVRVGARHEVAGTVSIRLRPR